MSGSRDGSALGRPPQRADERLGLRGDVLGPLPVRVGDRAQHLPERGQPVPRLGREVRAAEERLAVGREEDGQRPAALPGERDDGVHVDRVDVRPLLAIDLDVDEELVHHRRGRLVVERLALHHVAPVAGGVADRDEQRLALRAGATERLLPPRLPVDRVVGVLEEVRARLLRKPVHRGSVGVMSPAARRHRHVRLHRHRGLDAPAAGTRATRTTGGSRATTGGSCARRSGRTAERRSTRRATRSSSRSRVRATRSRPRSTRSAPSTTTSGPAARRCSCAWAIHTGEPHIGDEGYLGLDVVRAARISAAGHGGQILDLGDDPRADRQPAPRRRRRPRPRSAAPQGRAARAHLRADDRRPLAGRQAVEDGEAELARGGHVEAVRAKINAFVEGRLESALDGLLDKKRQRE